MTNDPETKVDTIELEDNEPVVFSDNPDGTPRDLPAEKPAKPEGEPPAEAASDGDDAPPPDAATDRPRKRPRKDLQERIDKLVRAAHESDEARAAAEAKAALLEQQLQDARKTAPQIAADERERAVTERKAQALKDMDLAAYDAAMSELLEIRIERKAANAEKPARETRAPAEDGGIHPAAQAWLHRSPWFNARENQHLAAEVVRIQNRLIKDGMQYSEELYRKIDEELDKLPEFDPVRQPARVKPAEAPAADAAADTAPEVPRPRSIVSPPTGSDVPSAPRPRPGALTKYDIETMKRFGLDHSNPKVRDAYLARKSQSA